MLQGTWSKCRLRRAAVLWDESVSARLMYLIASGYVQTAPDEFSTGGKFMHLGVPFIRNHVS